MVDMVGCVHESGEARRFATRFLEKRQAKAETHGAQAFPDASSTCSIVVRAFPKSRTIEAHQVI
jgi:hypothetical protein